MKVSSIAQLIFKVRLGCRNVSVLQILALATWLTGLVFWFALVPYLKHQFSIDQNHVEQLQALLDRLPVATSSDVTSPSEQHLQHFYATLGEAHYAEQQVATLIALANKNGLNIAQTEYKLTENKNGNFRSYMVTIPVKGQYAMIRSFCDQMLTAIPFASLDELNFKRVSISSQIVETRLRFTLYLDDSDGVEGRTFFMPHKSGNAE